MRYKIKKIGNFRYLVAKTETGGEIIASSLYELLKLAHKI